METLKKFVLQSSLSLIFGSSAFCTTSALLHAVESKDLGEVVQQLRLGANINGKGDDRTTALHKASFLEVLDIVECLLSGEDIDVNAKPMSVKQLYVLPLSESTQMS